MSCTSALLSIGLSTFGNSANISGARCKQASPFAGPWSLRLFCALLCVALCTAGAWAQNGAHPVSNRFPVGSGFKSPQGLFMDSNGALWVADTGNKRVVKLVPNGGASFTQTTMISASEHITPVGIAADYHAGYVWVADSSNGGWLWGIPFPGSGNTSLFQYSAPNIAGVYLDQQYEISSSNADVYALLGYTYNVANPTLFKLPYPYTSPQTETYSIPTGSCYDTGYCAVYSMAASSAAAHRGFFYVGAASGGGVGLNMGQSSALSTLLTIGDGFGAVIGLAANGDTLYATWQNTQGVEVIQVHDPECVDLGIWFQCIHNPDEQSHSFITGFNYAYGVALDGAGDLFVADQGANQVVEVPTSPVTWYSHDLGSINVGSSSNTLALQFQFDEATTLAYTPYQITTIGSTDASIASFTDAGSSTCKQYQSYNAGDICTVNLKFAPKYPGLVEGAVQLEGQSVGTLATAYLHGVGVAPEVSFAGTSSVTPTSIHTGFGSPAGIAVQGPQIYVADQSQGYVGLINTQCTGICRMGEIGNGTLQKPTGVALDGAGNLFVTDMGTNKVYEIPGQALGSGFNQPSGIAVDGSGNVFVADSGNGVVKELVAPGYTTVNTLGGTFTEPVGIALDVSGNVFVSDIMGGTVSRIDAPGYTQVDTLITGLYYPGILSVDAAGNVYVTAGVVKEFLAPTYAESLTVANASGAYSLGAIALDPWGNLYFTDDNSNALLEVHVASPPTLQFGSVDVGVASAEQTVTVQNIGNAPLKLPPPSTGTNPSVPAYFTLDSSAATACPVVTTSSAAGSLASGALCSLSISFDPPSAAAYQGGIGLTDNSLNAPSPSYVKQVIAMSADGVLAPQTITFPNPGTQAYASPLTLTAMASSGLAVIYASLTLPVCTVSGNTVTFVVPGTCTIQATQPGNTDHAAAPAVSQSFTVVKAKQGITFPAIPSTTLVTGTVTLTATASSGLPVSYASVTPTICTVSGSTVALVAVGNCGILASQAGNSDFAAAPAVGNHFAVTLATQTITFPAIPTQTYGTPVTLSATASSGLAVTFASITPTACTVSGTTATLLSSGTCSIRATQAGNVDYAAATAVAQSFTVLHEAQTITFRAIPTQRYGNPVTLSATASSGLAVTFASTTPTVCTVSGTTATLLSSGICAIEATQAGNTDYAAATAVSQSFTVMHEAQTITFPTIPATTLVTGSVALTATASSGLPVTYTSVTTTICTVSGSTVTLVAVGNCGIVANQVGNLEYYAAPAVGENFHVTLATQAITFPAVPTQTYGNPVTLSATASSGLAVTFASTTPTICTVSGTTATLLSSGTCTARATQAGNVDYAVAAAVAESFTVLHEAQTITFPAIPATTLLTGRVTLTATASSGLPVSYTAATPTVCTVSGSTLSLLAIGNCGIVANQAGNSDFAAAPAVGRNFAVTLATQTITFPAISSTPLGTGTVTLTATASSGLAVTYTSATPTVCTISGNVATLVTTGNCGIVAHQAGNFEYYAAPAVGRNFTVSAAT